MNSSKEQKEKIVNSLKSIVVSRIKELGFSGTFPHFRRNKHDRYEFLSFQFNRHGGSFIVEAGFVSPNLLLEWEKELPFEKLNYGNTRAENRLRIKPNNAHEDFWFEYFNFNQEVQFDNLAQSVKALLPEVEHFLEK